MRTEEIPVVVNADDMDDETFIKHFEARHSDQMPNLQRFVHTARRDPDTVELYRKFHDRLHELFTMEERHEHRTP